MSSQTNHHRSYTLTREQIPPVVIEELDEIERINLKEKIKKLKENENLKAFILDLRNNPGGLLTQAIKISDFFLDNGEIVSTKSRKKSENRKWFARKVDITDGKT